MITAIVLAAGLSRRMGGADKLFLPWNNQTILETVVEALEKVKGIEIIVVGGAQTGQINARLADLNAQIIYNARFETGMTSSIQTGVEAVNASATGFMICLGDMPSIKTFEYQLIVDAFEQSVKNDPQTIILPIFDHKKGNPVIFSNFYRSQILAHTESEGCKGIVQKAGGHVRLIKMPSANILKDIDSPEDYRAIAASHNLPDD